MAEKVLVSNKKSKTNNENIHKNRTEVSLSLSSPSDRILFIQRTIGNQAVGRLIKSGALLTRLRIGQPGDIYEQEADRVADQVMRMPELPVSKSIAVSEKTSDNPIQRRCPKCTANRLQEEEEVLQPKEVHGSVPEVAPGLETDINAIKGGGQPLPEAVRAFFEPRFGHDFSQVRVHTDAKAAESARAVNAQAFTVGNEIIFGAGRYVPETSGGQRLLAHELVHVVQQQGKKDQVQRLTDPVNLNPVRSNAQACLLHLHGNETNALSVAQDLYNTHCVNLAYIDHPGSRLINVDVPSHRGVTCKADPNRIFDDTAIDNQWRKWNSGQCLHNPIKRDAQAAVRDYRDNILNPKIRQCRGRPITQGQVDGTGVIGNLPIAVFHNNAPGSPTASPTRRNGSCREDLTIRSYLPGHCEAAATETDTGRTHGFANPNIISGENVDNFYLVTDPADFLALRAARNVVLQSLSAPNDGSLSVVLRSGRYVNIEAQSTRRNMRENQALGTETMTALGVSQLPCPAASSGQASSETGIQAGASQSASEVIQRIPGTQIQLQITSRDLTRQRTSDLDRFMRHVYDLQVQLWTSQGAAYVAGVPNADLVTVASRDVLPGRHIQLHRDVASSMQSLLADARRDLAAAQAAHSTGAQGVTDLRLRSGYRSAQEQLIVWEQNYPQYYRVTRAHRLTLSGGEHGEDAARYLAAYINQRVFSPGYSPHQQGQTVDFTYNQNNRWAEADSSAAGMSMWQSSWLFGWLQAHAASYGFVQNPNINEPWHWEYHPTMALLISFFQWLKDLVLRILQSLRRLFVGEEVPSGEQTPHPQ